jgi:hypothetical protein
MMGRKRNDRQEIAACLWFTALVLLGITLWTW